MKISKKITIRSIRGNEMIKESGNRYGHLTIVEDTGKRYHGSIVYKCLCDCGNYKEVDSNKLHSGHVTSCGCARHMVKDLTGMRFGKLTVVSFAKREKGKTYWNCKCDCGNECIASSCSLKEGSTVSCGCVNKENRKNIVTLRKDSLMELLSPQLTEEERSIVIINPDTMVSVMIVLGSCG